MTINKTKANLQEAARNLLDAIDKIDVTDSDAFAATFYGVVVEMKAVYSAIKKLDSAFVKAKAAA